MPYSKNLCQALRFYELILLRRIEAFYLYSYKTPDMRKWIVLYMITMVCLTAKSQTYKGDSWSTVKLKGSGTLTVVYIEQFGLVHKDNQGNMKGVCVDILSDFAKYVKEKHGKTIKVNYAGEEPVFANFLNAVQNTPNILGVTNTTITDERKKTFRFSPPYMLNRLVLLTHNDAPVVSTLSELSTKLAGFSAQVIAGSTHIEYIRKVKDEHFPSLKVTQGASGPVIINNLIDDRKLFTIIDLTEFIGATRQKLPVKRHPVDVGVVEELGFIMSLQSDWDTVFNEFLTADYRNSTRYRQIIAQNLSSTYINLVR